MCPACVAIGLIYGLVTLKGGRLFRRADAARSRDRGSVSAAEWRLDPAKTAG